MSESPQMPAGREDVQALWEASSRRLRAWFARRAGSEHDAEDLVQETFLRVQAKLPTLREGERLDAWLGAVARNVLADFGRARGRRPAELDEAAGDGPLGRAPEDVAGEDLGAAVASWLEAFLERLGPEDAALLRAVDLEGRAQIAVARELGIAPSSARSRVQRARARLRRELEACCAFAFDARGNVVDAVRRQGGTCGCEPC